MAPPADVMGGGASSAVVVDGQVISTVARSSAAEGEREIIGPDFSVMVRVMTATGAPVPMDADTLMVPQGGRVEAVGDGYLPGSMVRVFLVPRTPVDARGLTGRAATGAMFLGEVSVDSSGDFAQTFFVPVSVSVGEYVLQINGESPRAQVRSVNMGLVVEPGAAPLEPGKTQRAGFFKGLSDDLSVSGKRKLRQIVRSMPQDAQAVQVLVAGVSVGLDDLRANAVLAAERASVLATELEDRGVVGEFVITVTTSYTADGAERSAAEKADVLTTKAGKPLSTVTVLFQEPVSS